MFAVGHETHNTCFLNDLSHVAVGGILLHRDDVSTLACTLGAGSPVLQPQLVQLDARVQLGLVGVVGA